MQQHDDTTRDALVQLIADAASMTQESDSLVAYIADRLNYGGFFLSLAPADEN